MQIDRHAMTLREVQTAVKAQIQTHTHSHSYYGSYGPPAMLATGHSVLLL